MPGGWACVFHLGIGHIRDDGALQTSFRAAVAWLGASRSWVRWIILGTLAVIKFTIFNHICCL